MIYIGIDPGLTGALAVIYGEDGPVRVYDAPVFKTTKRVKVTKTTEKVRKKSELSEQAMAQLIREIVFDGPTKLAACAAIERVHAMPKAGASGMFSFGTGYGLWRGVLAGLGVPFDIVEPSRWKKEMMNGMGKQKQAAMFRALQLFPALAPDIRLKKHDGRAEALLIAEYRRRQG